MQPRHWPAAAEHLPSFAQPGEAMGIINATPDSFSDGGQHNALPSALAYAHALEAAGVRWVDVGGESTRPGAEPVSAEVEIERVVPLIAAIRGETALHISIDTSKAEVARAALRAGACMVNDVSAGRDPAMFPLVAETRALMVLMHMQGEPRSMQQAPHYDDVVAEVGAFLSERIAAACAAGIARECLLIDPGIGFGKTVAHNRSLLRGLDTVVERCQRPLLLGMSRKRMLTELLERPLSRERRDALTQQCSARLAPACVLLRVHDACGSKDAIDFAAAMGWYDHEEPSRAM